MCKIEIFEQELRLRYSDQTVKSYSRQFELFLKYFEAQDIRYLSTDLIKSYILFLHSIYGYSAIIHAISAIEFYYSQINSRQRTLNLPRPKKPSSIPTVLSIDEVKKIFSVTLNIKHLAMIQTMFYHGLRRSELLNLKIVDIDSSLMELRVIQSKGLKDRSIPLSDECLNTLRLYYKTCKPKEYLFNGADGGKYSPTSLGKIIKNAAKLAGIKKNVHPHTLRHSFASYLVSINVNLKKIQEWLGHKSSKTTEIYCHITHEANPIRIAI